MSLPSFNTSDRILSMMQSAWASQLDPIVDNPLVQGNLLQNITLASGTNTINHKLSRKLRGYIVVLKSTNVSIYDNQSTNAMADKTLILVASGASTVSIWVF